MAATITENESTILGSKRVVFATYTFDDSYPTGGEAVAASEFDSLTAIEHIVIASQDVGGGEQVVWDKANAKLLVFTADGTEATNTSDQSGVSVELMVFGY